MEKKEAIYLKDYKKSDFEISSIDLEFDIFDDFVEVKATTTL